MTIFKLVLATGLGGACCTHAASSKYSQLWMVCAKWYNTQSTASALDLDTLSDWGSLRLLLYICPASNLLG